jgi:uncharacterized protein YbjT (DUF2867 family)
MTSPLIVVFGATGTTGSEVVGQLVDCGRRVRAVVRDRFKAAKFGKDVEVVQADLAEQDALAAACAGADKAFIVSVGPGLVLEANAFAAAKGAGIRHIVRVSAQEIEFPELAATPLGKAHLEAEQRLRECGVAWTLLRPSYFATNTLLPFILDRREGASFVPTGDGKEAPIDPRDIAAVAVRALTTPGHKQEVYLMTGPELLSYADMMGKASRAVGKQLRHVDMPEDAARKRLLALGLPPPVAESLIGHFAAVKAGRAYVTSTVGHLLGRPARTFDDWIDDHTAALKG